MNNELQRMYAVLDSLTASRLPDRDDLALFIETCAPDLFSGPVPDGIDAMEAEFLHEAGMDVNTVPALDHPCQADISKEEAEALREELFRRARVRAQEHFGKRIYMRGLIEISNFCRQNCRYCGIRCGNSQVERYRLTPEQILECCEHGYELGFRTFVMQGGEDGWFTDKRLCDLLREMKKRWPDCAITLSVGEKSEASYRKLKEAGADRFLLRHESADPQHFAKLHPSSQTWESRKACLRALKACGFQTGAGFMIGSPWQSTATIIKDLEFLCELQPEMVGMGPFIPHSQTPFADFPSGSVQRTLVLLAIVRLLLPAAMLPATTALGTAAGDGRERGILAGANVLMPNLSPKAARDRYRLYNNKLSEGAECADNIEALKARIRSIGYEIVTDRGDFRPL